MTAPISETDLHAWADRQLDASRRADVEDWLANHPDARARAEEWRAQNALLRGAYDPVLDQAVPTRLLEAAQAKRSSRLSSLAHFSIWRAAAVFVWLMLGGLAGYALRDGMTSSTNIVMASLPRQAAIAHAVFSPEVRHPVEVAAEQEPHLTTWLSKRLGTKLKPPRLESAGFSLIGGRLLPAAGAMDGRPVAQFMYQNGRGQRLTLYVRNDVGGNRETAFRFTQEKNISVFYWIDGSLGYALSGELPRAELLQVATLAYQQLNP